MFQNVGSKLKTMAKVFCFIGIGASIIYGIMMMVTLHQTIAGLLIIILGSLASWLSCLSLYGLGIVVEDHETPASDNSNALSKQIRTLQDDISALSVKTDQILSSKYDTSKMPGPDNASFSVDNNSSHPKQAGQEPTGIQDSVPQEALPQNKNFPSSADGNTRHPIQVEQKPAGIQDDAPQESMTQKKLRPVLEYALKFNTDDGLTRYLNRECSSLAPEEQVILSELIDRPVDQVREAASAKLKEL